MDFISGPVPPGNLIRFPMCNRLYKKSSLSHYKMETHCINKQEPFFQNMWSYLEWELMTLDINITQQVNITTLTRKKETDKIVDKP